MTKVKWLKWMNWVNGGVAAVLAASLAGCGGFNAGSLNPWSGPVEITSTVPAGATVYACEGGKRLVVRYLSGPDAAMIVFRDREFRLDPSASAQGARYTNGSTTLQSAADLVSLEEEGSVTYTNCRKATG